MVTLSLPKLLVYMMMVLTASMLFILCRTHKMAMVSTIVDPRGEFGDMPLNNTPTKTASAKTTNHRNTQQLHMPRILALYFPQYHADPINDKHWGTNFTDHHPTSIEKGMPFHVQHLNLGIMIYQMSNHDNYKANLHDSME